MGNSIEETQVKVLAALTAGVPVTSGFGPGETFPVDTLGTPTPRGAVVTVLAASAHTLAEYINGTPPDPGYSFPVLGFSIQVPAGGATIYIGGIDVDKTTKYGAKIAPTATTDALYAAPTWLRDLALVSVQASVNQPISIFWGPQP